MEAKVVINSSQTGAAGGQVLVQLEAGAVDGAVVVQLDGFLEIVQGLDRAVLGLFANGIIKMGGWIVWV